MYVIDDFDTYVVSFCRIKSQINRIDGQSGSKRKCDVATSVKKIESIHKQIITNAAG